jgi:hypothetical protein
MLGNTSCHSALVTEFGWDELSGTGTVQVLDVRHSELFLEEGYRNGAWDYEDLGEHFMDEEAAAPCCAVFNHNRLDSTCAYCMPQPSDYSCALFNNVYMHMHELEISTCLH